MNSMQSSTSELENAKELQEITLEESSLRTLVDSLKLQLDNTKRERLEAEKEVIEAEIVAENMQIDLEISKREIEGINAGEVK